MDFFIVYLDNIRKELVKKLITELVFPLARDSLLGLVSNLTSINNENAINNENMNEEMTDIIKIIKSLEDSKY